MAGHPGPVGPLIDMGVGFMDAEAAAAGGHHVGLSNAWSVEPGGPDQDELLSVVGGLHPGAGVSDCAAGTDLDAMLAAGYVALGPHLVWSRAEPSSSGKAEAF